MYRVTQQYAHHDCLPHAKVPGNAQHDGLVEGKEHVGGSELVEDNLVVGVVREVRAEGVEEEAREEDA